MENCELKEVKRKINILKEIRVKANGVNVWVKVSKDVARGVVNSVNSHQRVWFNTNYHQNVGYLVVKNVHK